MRKDHVVEREEVTVLRYTFALHCSMDMNGPRLSYDQLELVYY